jgi:hypothetical protein
MASAWLATRIGLLRVLAVDMENAEPYWVLLA